VSNANKETYVRICIVSKSAWRPYRNAFGKWSEYYQFCLF